MTHSPDSPPHAVPNTYSCACAQVPRSAEYVAPSHFEQDGRTFYTNFSLPVYIDDAGAFQPLHIGVQMGTAVTFHMRGFQSARVEARVEEANSSWSSARLNRLPDPASGVKPTFTIFFQELNDGEDAGAGRGSSTAADLVIRTAGELVHFTNPFADASAGGGASGSILVKALRCEALLDCTSCLLYDPCIWCSGNASCFTRNATTNLPVDAGVVVQSNPDSFAPSGMSNREYSLLKLYNPPTSISGFDWYPWPRQRSIPRPAKDWEVPGMRSETPYFFPISSDLCPSYADRSLGPKGARTRRRARVAIGRGARCMRGGASLSPFACPMPIMEVGWPTRLHLCARALTLHPLLDYLTTTSHCFAPTQSVPSTPLPGLACACTAEKPRRVRAR